MTTRQATLDLLDADLKDGHDMFMKLDDKVHFKNFRQEMVISPRYWTAYAPEVSRHALNWVEVEYSKLAGHLDSLASTDPGLYIFFTQPVTLCHGMPRFAFYVGISGEGGSARPLKERLADYLRLPTLKKRQNVHLALQMYYPTVRVVYSLLNIPFADLEALEVAFHGYLYPWAARRDFPIEIKGPQKAWGGV